MTVELNGKVRMRGDVGPGVTVRVLAERARLRIVSGNELVGEWAVSEIGINALQDGFNIKAEGEEFFLRTEDDAALADELGVIAVSPRLGRRLAVRHNPEEPDDLPVRDKSASGLAALGFAIAGALVLAGGTFLNVSGDNGDTATLRSGTDGSEFWIAFVIGGVLMIGAAFVMSIGTRMARGFATVVLLAVLVVVGVAISRTQPLTTQLTAYGFIAGGLLVGFAVLVSESLRQD